MPSALVDMYQCLGEFLLPCTAVLKLDTSGSSKRCCLPAKLPHVASQVTIVLIDTLLRTSDLTPVLYILEMSSCVHAVLKLILMEVLKKSYVINEYLR
jgi:hypothetical protein